MKLGRSPIYPKSISSYNPIPGGIYIPLWNPACQGTTFKTMDAYGHACTNAGVTYVAKGGVFGGDDSIDITSALTSLAATTKGTWFMWYNPTDSTPPGYEIPMGFGDTSADEYIYLQIVGTTGEFKARCVVAGTAKWDVNVNANSFTSGVFASIAIVQNGTAPVLYVNGVAPAQTTSVTTDRTIWFSGCAGIDNGYIGARNIGGTGLSLYANQTVGDVILDDINWTAAQVLYAHNQTKGRYA